MYYLPKIEACNSSMPKAQAVINNLNINQLEHLDGEIFAQDYWFEQGAKFIDATVEQMKFLNDVRLKIQALITSGKAKLEHNSNGLTVKRSSCIGTLGEFERTLKGDWKTLLCIDAYHGYWIERSTFQIVSYCEGDVVLLTAADAKQFELEVESTQTWYKENY